MFSQVRSVSSRYQLSILCMLSSSQVNIALGTSGQKPEIEMLLS
jgi:hypothetical protein